MSDEREGAGSADDTGTDTGTDADSGQTAVVTRPLRPTGKRNRRGAAGASAGDETADGDASDDAGAESAASKKAKKKAAKTGPSRNPVMYVINYLRQVVAELRKVIWPNRKQMVSYTSVVLTFLVFMVALIYGADLALAELVSLAFGT